MTPDQALAALNVGNERFVNGKMLQRDLMGKKQLKVDGAMYDVATGRATFTSDDEINSNGR